MKRHRDREIAVSTLYSLDFNNSMELTDDIDLFQGMSEEEVASLDDEDKAFVRFLVVGTLENLAEIDSLISRYSLNRPIDKIDIVDRNILRISFYQLAISRDVHPLVVIDEAVKLSQELSNDVSFRFINGLLDAYRKENLSHDNAEK